VIVLTATDGRRVCCAAIDGSGAFLWHVITGNEVRASSGRLADAFTSLATANGDTMTIDLEDGAVSFVLSFEETIKLQRYARWAAKMDWRLDDVGFEPTGPGATLDVMQA